MRVVLGVSGGIAAYKACSLLRMFTEGGHDVTVVPTEAALRFVGTATWEALSGKPVSTGVWDHVDEVAHVRIGQLAELLVVAPATADLLAKAAGGLADDLLTATLLTARCPVVFAPAMHTEMWEHPATQANVATLRARGARVIDPASGRLTGPDSGAGRLPEPADLYAACLAVVSATRPLAGRRVVVTAGGTREPLDPVRFLGNRSSGKQGAALAEVAVARGAEVTLVAATMRAAVPEGVRLVRVETALDLQEAVTKEAVGADVVVMCAAVADFRPAHYEGTKIKKTYHERLGGSTRQSAPATGDEPAPTGDPSAWTGDEPAPTGDPSAWTGDEPAPTIELVRNPDILAGLVAERAARGDAAPYLVGFAAETGDDTGSALQLARVKLTRKGCDLLVANEVGVDKVFGADNNTVHLLHADGRAERTVGPTSKAAVAEAVWDGIQAVLGHA
ncbi:MAG: bifunctional phosphopantothenoylcysteine decarboxylase/phosphopantothenate--cysteine ligase CoaBC [Dermatophilaceae bacterium]